MAKRYKGFPVGFPGANGFAKLNMSGKFSSAYVGTFSEYGEPGYVYRGSASDIRKVARTLREHGACEDDPEIGVFLNQYTTNSLREGQVYALFMPEYRLEYAAFKCE